MADLELGWQGIVIALVAERDDSRAEVKRLRDEVKRLRDEIKRLRETLVVLATADRFDAATQEADGPLGDGIDRATVRAAALRGEEIARKARP